MRKPSTALLALSLLLSAGACGGGADPEPLISGSLTGDFQGSAFTPVNGFVEIYEVDGASSPVFGLGDGNLHCGSIYENEPPSGTNAIFSVPLSAGSYSSVLIEIIQNHGNYEGHGSNSGSVTITSVTADSVAGSVSYADTIDGMTYGINGTFEVVHCQ